MPRASTLLETCDRLLSKGESGCFKLLDRVRAGLVEDVGAVAKELREEPRLVSALARLFTDAAAILARKDGEAAASYDDRLCALLRAMDGLLDSQPAVKRLGGSCAFLAALLGLALSPGTSSRLRRLALACVGILLGDRSAATKAVAAAYAPSESEEEGAGTTLRGSINELAASVFEPHFATMEAQEAACEIVFHWLTALRRLAFSSSSHTAGKHARRFADGLPKALRALAVFQPQEEEEEAEDALTETIRRVLARGNEESGHVLCVEGNGPLALTIASPSHCSAKEAEEPRKQQGGRRRRRHQEDDGEAGAAAAPTACLPLSHLSFGRDESRYTPAADTEEEEDGAWDDQSFFISYACMEQVHFPARDRMAFGVSGPPPLLALLRLHAGVRRLKGKTKKTKREEAELSTANAAALTVLFPSPKAAAATRAFLEARLDPGQLLSSSSASLSPSSALVPPVRVRSGGAGKGEMAEEEEEEEEEGKDSGGASKAEEGKGTVTASPLSETTRGGKASIASMRVPAPSSAAAPDPFAHPSSSSPLAPPPPSRGAAAALVARRLLEESQRQQKQGEQEHVAFSKPGLPTMAVAAGCGGVRRLKPLFRPPSAAFVRKQREAAEEVEEAELPLPLQPEVPSVQGEEGMGEEACIYDLEAEEEGPDSDEETEEMEVEQGNGKAVAVVEGGKEQQRGSGAAETSPLVAAGEGEGDGVKDKEDDSVVPAAAAVVAAGKGEKDDVGAALEAEAAMAFCNEGQQQQQQQQQVVVEGKEKEKEGTKGSKRPRSGQLELVVTKPPVAVTAAAAAVTMAAGVVKGRGDKGKTRGGGDGAGNSNKAAQRPPRQQQQQQQQQGQQGQQAKGKDAVAMAAGAGAASSVRAPFQSPLPSPIVPAANQQQPPPQQASNDKATQATATAPAPEQEGAEMEVEGVEVVEALRAAGGKVAKALDSLVAKAVAAATPTSDGVLQTPQVPPCALPHITPTEARGLHAAADSLGRWIDKARGWADALLVRHGRAVQAIGASGNDVQMVRASLKRARDELTKALPPIPDKPAAASSSSSASASTKAVTAAGGHSSAASSSSSSSSSARRQQQQQQQHEQQQQQHEQQQQQRRRRALASGTGGQLPRLPQRNGFVSDSERGQAKRQRKHE